MTDTPQENNPPAPDGAEAAPSGADRPAPNHTDQPPATQPESPQGVKPFDAGDVETLLGKEEAATPPDTEPIDTHVGDAGGLETDEPDAATPHAGTPAPATQDDTTPTAAETAPADKAFDLSEIADSVPTNVDPKRVTMLNDVNLGVKIELGRTRMLVEDVLKLDEGSVVELDKLAGDPVDVYVNGRLIARGEVLVLNDSFCVRISEVLSHDPHRISV